MQPIVAGRKRTVLESIMRDTSTNIFVPSLVGRLPSEGEEHNSPDAISDSAAAVWITGDAYGIRQAKDMLLAQLRQKAARLTIKSAQCLPRCMDWMLLHRRDNLLKIMYDNATFLHLPTLGASTNVLFVAGDNRVFVERSIRAVMSLACKFYLGCIQLVPTQPPVTVSGYPSPPNTVDVPTSPSLKPIVIATPTSTFGNICHICKADIVLRKGVVEVYGLERMVKESFRMITELDVAKVNDFFWFQRVRYGLT
jgi:hypothetical protein